jgi:hypothetical protein
MALSTSDFFTGEFHSVCGRVSACVRASVHLDMTHLIFVVDLNSALDEKQWDHWNMSLLNLSSTLIPRIPAFLRNVTRIIFIISPYILKWFVFVMDACCVFCEVRILFLNTECIGLMIYVVNLHVQTKSCPLSACCSNKLIINILKSLALDSTPNNSNDIKPSERHPTGTL